MKFALILFFAVLAIASAQRRVERPSRRLYRLPVHRYRLADDDQHFASLGGADVGRYSREHQGWTVLPRRRPRTPLRINLESLKKKQEKPENLN
ncbi:hypothetical protein TNCT_53551 [Trichonephila clavata]|uniref:Uncharacterized protein n=1 Tax=Trichonephila clavata TaxID=2740835 RepID=A0A8X6LYA8_TRICU|nr:hypothetical protein TNCT_53551 [Trichonephila clavata]